MGRPNVFKGTAGSWETEEARRESEALWSSLRQSDSALAESLNAIPELRVWLDGTGSDAEPKAFVRLALLLVKNGESLMISPASVFFSTGAGPPDQDQVLKLTRRWLCWQSLKMPIKLYFTKARRTDVDE